jgi:hypothetical protein
MKFEYGVTNGECVENKKFGGQNLKKDKLFAVCHTHGTWQSLCLLCVSLKHTANPGFIVCLAATHGKH